MTIFVGVPTYDERIHAKLNLTLLNEVHVPNTPEFLVASAPGSLLALTFNKMYCQALNMRDKGMTHFLMIHADIVPEAGFVGRMFAEMERIGADVLSVVMPIKSNDGLSSTAFLPNRFKPYNRRRLTMRELEQLPVTFDVNDVAKLCDRPAEGARLLVNTGLMLIDLRKPFADQCWFEINDRIVKTNEGKFEPRVEPEDWHYSRLAGNLGARVMATKIVKAKHYGNMGFPNYGSWGTVEHEGVSNET